MNPLPPRAVLLGTNEIASAVAVYLSRAGWAVVMSHDPEPPVIRRGMAFHDVLWGDPATVEGVAAAPAETLFDVWAALKQPSAIVVTRLGLADLVAVGGIDMLADARMQKRLPTPDFRNLARLTVGLGPGFAVDRNCDVAVETHPARNGSLVLVGATEEADGITRSLGGLGAERFVYSEAGGRFHTPLGLGARVYRGLPLGQLGIETVHAPIDGILRGIVRDGTEVPAGVKLIEIDPRGRVAEWRGIDERAHRIAAAVLKAAGLRAPRRQRRENLPLEETP